MNLKDGEFLVKTARKAVESYFTGEKLKIESTKFKEKQGAFVTITSLPGHELRGCIGYSFPVKPLIEAVKEVAVQAAVGDPRFPSLRKEDLNNILIEVTVLTEPELIKGKNKEKILKKIEIGKHGLVIDAGFTSGLLLPQVAVEYEWTPEEFLSQTCWKAGIEPSAWLDPHVKIYRFEGQIFSETTPKGKVVEKKIKVITE